MKDVPGWVVGESVYPLFGFEGFLIYYVLTDITYNNKRFTYPIDIPRKR